MMKPREKSDGTVETPAEVEARLSLAIDGLRNVTLVVLAILLAANLIAIGVSLARGNGNHDILTTLQHQSGPEAAAVQKAYLDLVRAEINCDGDRRDEEHDNTLLEVVSGVVPQLHGQRVSYVATSEACNDLPRLQSVLVDASAKLAAVKQK